MVSFIDMVDSIKELAKKQRQKKSSTTTKQQQQQQHQHPQHHGDLSRRSTWDSLSSTDSASSVERSKSTGPIPRPNHNLSRAVTPQYPRNWETSVRNPRRQRTTPAARSQRGSADSGVSAHGVRTVAPPPPPPPYDPRQPLHMLEEE